MTSTAGKTVWLVGGAMLAYSLAVSLGLTVGLIQLRATTLCIALLCLATCLWYVNAYLDAQRMRFGWGLLTNAAGWGVVSLAFLVPEGWHLAFSLVAAGLIALGGAAAWLAIRERNESPPGT